MLAPMMRLLRQSWWQAVIPLWLLGVGLTSAEEASGVKLQPIFENVGVTRPITVAVPQDGTRRLFLVQQRGQVRILPKDESSKDAITFLDLSDRHMEATKESEFEEGLVGFAFHPKFKENGKFYLYYTQQDPKRARLSEMRVSAADPNKADPSTERVLLEVPLPYWNHHSGNLAFGPDGLLYLTIGDGGGHPGGDPLRLAQNVFVFNGKVLRIDVDKKTGAREYGIPADNPFAGKEAAREEIYAYGMRNPWGLSFDEQGTLWCADVGQDLWEEIDFIQNGGNYGWSFREGKHKFVVRTDDPPPGTTFVEPIFEYDHTQGLSITGGFVYRGSKLPQLKGAYLYGDWAWGRIWALKYDKEAKKVLSNVTLHQPSLDTSGKTPKALFQPTCFCEDADHEPLALDWNGRIFRLVAQTPAG
jgi:quinoprotein glucose dehydrogenase